MPVDDQPPPSPGPARPRPTPAPSAPERIAERRDRTAFFFGFLVALLVAVPVSLLGLKTLADNLTALLAAVVAALVVVAVFAVGAFWFRRRLFRGVLGSLPRVYAPVPEALRHLKAGDPGAAADAAEEAGQRLVAWVGWISLRNWVLRGLVGVVAAFAALLGSVLLWEQNRLLTVQNDLMSAQNAYFQRQIGQDSEQWAEVRRSQLRTLLIEVDCRSSRPGTPCQPVAGPVARGQALAALAALERTAGRTPLELFGLDLRGADLRGADLSQVRLVDADLRGALLDDARLVDAAFPGAELAGASLQGAWVDGADWLTALTRGPDAASSLGEADWQICDAPTGWRVQATFPGCDGTVVTARAVPAVRDGAVRLGPAAADVARVSLGGQVARVNCSTLGERLNCELALGDEEIGTRLHWGAGRLLLAPLGPAWTKTAVAIPAVVYQRLRLDRFNPR